MSDGGQVLTRRLTSMGARIGLAVLVGALVPLVVFGGLVYLEQAEHERAQALEALTTVADIQAARVEAFERASLATARQVAVRTDVRTELARIADGGGAELEVLEAAAREATAAAADAMAVSVTDRDGVVVVSTTPSAVGTTPPGVADLPLANPTAAEFRLIGPQEQGTVGGERPHMLVSIPVALGGRPVGAVAVAVSIEPLSRLATEHDGLGETGETVLATRTVGGDARIITPLRFDPEAAFSRVVPGGDSRTPTALSLQGQEALLEDAVDYRGLEVLAVTRYLPDSGIGLVAKIDQAEALAPIGEVAELLLVGAAVAAVVAIALAWALGRRLARPVAELRRTAVRIGRGETDARADTDAPGELADLAVTLNQMAGEIAAAREGLEAEVAARTADLEEKIKELEHRNEELDAFSSAVAHDLKSPLSVVKAAVETVSAGRVDEERAAKLMEASVTAANRMRDLIDDLLALARTGTDEIALDEVAVAELVADVCQHLGLDDIVEVGPLPVIAADASLLRQALQNLLDNAATYGGADGPARIVVASLDGDPETVMVAVDDNGRGIPPDEREAVFQPFARGSSAAGTSGTGVGLAIVARIAERHGGSVTATDSPLGGTRMILALPGDRVVMPATDSARV